MHFPQRMSLSICKALSFSARLRPARASSEGLGWLAGMICDLASPLGVTAPSGVALSFSRRTNDKAPTSSGLLLFCGYYKIGALSGAFEALFKAKTPLMAGPEDKLSS
ncbi:hypothetical protein D3C78_526450 [compost metagenome]